MLVRLVGLSELRKLRARQDRQVQLDISGGAEIGNLIKQLQARHSGRVQNWRQAGWLAGHFQRPLLTLARRWKKQHLRGALYLYKVGRLFVAPPDLLSVCVSRRRRRRRRTLRAPPRHAEPLPPQQPKASPKCHDLSPPARLRSAPIERQARATRMAPTSGGAKRPQEE